MKKVLAVVVSIFWLTLIVGIPALVLTGNAARIIPPSLQAQLAGLGGQDLLDILGLTADPSSSVNEPIVVMETVTPTPEVEPTATPTELPSATPEPLPTATPEIIPTAESASETPSLPLVTFPVAVKGQADLRIGPGLSFDSVGVVDAGATILVSAQDESGEWFQLENGNWISSEALTSKPPVPIVLPSQEATPEAATPETPVGETTPAAPVVARVNGDSNLRSGPGSTFDRVGGVNLGSDVNVVGKFATDNWYLLDTGAWIFGELLESAPDVPQVNADGTPVGGTSAVATPPAATIVTPTVTTPATTGAPITATLTVNILANLRAAPNTSATITGSAQPGQTLVIVGKNAAGDWLKLENGSWIFAELLDNVPDNLPVADESAAVDTTAGTANPVAAATPATATTTVTGTNTVTGTLATGTSAVGSAAVDANLRTGPGTTFDLAGSITAGTSLRIVGRNEAGDWLKLDSNVWIFGELVADVPTGLPVVTQ